MPSKALSDVLSQAGVQQVELAAEPATLKPVPQSMGDAGGSDGGGSAHALNRKRRSGGRRRSVTVRMALRALYWGYDGRAYGGRAEVARGGNSAAL